MKRKEKDWKKMWIVDPLDGTKEFIKRNDEFTVNIALVEKGIPVLGVIYVPVLEELFFAAFNEDGAESVSHTIRQIEKNCGKLSPTETKIVNKYRELIAL